MSQGICSTFRRLFKRAAVNGLFLVFTTSLQASNDSYASLSDWRDGYFSDPDGISNGSDLADPDKDGQVNLVEYAFGSDPTEATSRGGFEVSIMGDDVTISYVRCRTDVTYLVEATSDFVNWTTDGVEQGSPSIGAVTARITDGAIDRKFGRMKLVSPEGVSVIPLFSEATETEPITTVDAPDALYTYFSDRGRDRHAREDQFQSYEHYLSFYWEHRTAEIEIVDTIPKGGNTITFNVRSLWKFKQNQAELRAFYRGIGTVAEYYDNKSMGEVNYNPSDGPFFSHYPDDLTPPTEDTRYYRRKFNYNIRESRQIQVGDRMEFEISHFLEDPPNGRENYYGTTYLYIVGKGLVPWYPVGVFGDASTEREDSYEIDASALLGGGTTLHYNVSDEPDNEFIQMATNLAPLNGQRFVLGRRVHHTDFGDGSHDEAVTNPVFSQLAGKLGERYVNRSCVSCHNRNGRALPPATGVLIDRYIFKIGDGNGNPHASAGSVLQPKSIDSETSEGSVVISEWEFISGLRKPIYEFEGIAPSQYSARIAPQLVGMGLLEAIPEAAITAQADPDDLDGDGISGRVHIVTDPVSGEPRVGRFGWKATQPSVRDQVASALNTDMGVMTSVFPRPDTGNNVPASKIPVAS